VSNSLSGREVKRLAINVAAADTELVAASAGVIVFVHGLVLSSAAVPNIVSLQSDGSSDTELLSLQFAIDTSGGIPPVVLPISDVPWVQTLAGEALDLRASDTTGVDGVLIYSTGRGA
jgi:hypothetical protein